MNVLETVIQAEINMSSKMGDSLFKLGRYNRVFLVIWAQIPIWAPMLKQWAVESFSSWQYSRRAHRDPQKFILFIKTSKWEKWWSWWLRILSMLSYSLIYCENFRNVLQRTREGSFNLPSLWRRSLKQTSLCELVVSMHYRSLWTVRIYPLSVWGVIPGQPSHTRTPTKYKERPRM